MSLIEFNGVATSLRVGEREKKAPVNRASRRPASQPVGRIALSLSAWSGQRKQLAQLAVHLRLSAFSSGVPVCRSASPRLSECVCARTSLATGNHCEHAQVNSWPANSRARSPERELKCLLYNEPNQQPVGLALVRRLSERVYGQFRSLLGCDPK